MLRFFALCLVSVTFSAVTLFLGARDTTSPSPFGQSSTEVLSAAGTEELRALVASGRLAELQWPNFSDHDASVKDFYDRAGYTLGWIRDGKPTQQAETLIGMFEQAELKGLNGSDYDGARWRPIDSRRYKPARPNRRSSILTSR